jgi:hypothetical protein
MGGGEVMEGRPGPPSADIKGSGISQEHKKSGERGKWGKWGEIINLPKNVMSIFPQTVRQCRTTDKYV